MAVSRSQAIGMMHKRYMETENLGIQYFIGKQEVVDHVIKSMKEVDWR